MKRILCLLGICLLSTFSVAAEYESLQQINSTNWAKAMDDLVGFPYDSHGCLHFAPGDIYLLYKTLPEGIPLKIKKYVLSKNDPAFAVDKVPFLVDMTSSTQDIEKHARMFKAYKTEVVVYPSLNLLFIMVNGYPYAKVKTLAGQSEEYLMAYSVEKGKPIEWDFMLSTPTDPGDFTILRKTGHYISNAYYQNTMVSFGAWLKKTNGRWYYQEKEVWRLLPENISSDLALPAKDRKYYYYDINKDRQGNITAARYAGHDFGKYVILWTADGKNHLPEMAYASGELVFEQIMLTKDLVHLLTLPEPDDFEACLAQNSNFAFYRDLFLFKNSKGKTVPANIQPAAFSYYKLFNGLELLPADNELFDPRAVKAYREQVENRLPRERDARRKALGLYNYLRFNSLVIDKQAGWYEKVRDDWEELKSLRQKLRQDFEAMGVYSLENRQVLLEKWLFDRQEFKKVIPPREARYVGELTFSSFFKPSEQSTLFTEREQALMREKIRKAIKGESQGLDLKIVNALNEYNFGVLLNEILGDLYKSHGCLHVSPRNMSFLYDLLPVNTQITIYPYAKTVSAEAFKNIPYLTDLVNFRQDLDNIRQRFASAEEVKVALYPSSGWWLIFVKGQPFAKLQVKGGPQTKMYLLQNRDSQGRPIFEDHLAYPTTPGTYYIFKKTKDYVSNIYRDTTLVPQGGIIKKQDGKWLFKNAKGQGQKITPMIEEDLKQPADKRGYSYYDVVNNASGEAIEMKWGSHPFGTFALQTSRDNRTAFPELIHSSGDLIMEERSLINDLIKILTAPSDELDDCIKLSQNFELYKACYDFMADPAGANVIQTRERASYKLHFGLPLSDEEARTLPPDIVAANKAARGQKLTGAEIKLLIAEGVASKRRGKVQIDKEKIIGLNFDNYQYVVAIQKFAHHYAVLKDWWAELSALRRALLADFNDFALKDPQVFHNFMRELMLSRNNLETLTQEKALQMLYEMMGQNGTSD